MSNTFDFPRVVYANPGVDLTALHDYLDQELPKFKASLAGKKYPNRIGAQDSFDGEPFTVFSPIDGKPISAPLSRHRRLPWTRRCMQPGQRFRRGAASAGRSEWRSFGTGRMCSKPENTSLRWPRYWRSANREAKR